MNSYGSTSKLGALNVAADTNNNFDFSKADYYFSLHFQHVFLRSNSKSGDNVPEISGSKR
ncbi:MAG: hypothetical protein GY928_30020 [Colwellia sp.]|nr:hypothetical protein [Colwellia sp.]